MIPASYKQDDAQEGLRPVEKSDFSIISYLYEITKDRAIHFDAGAILDSHVVMNSDS